MNPVQTSRGRRGLAPLELVLALPILLFVMALIVCYGTISAWKVREHSVARLAAWETGWRSSTENIRRLVRRVGQTVQFRPPRCGTNHHRSRIYGYGQVF